MGGKKRNPDEHYSSGMMNQSRAVTHKCTAHRLSRLCRITHKMHPAPYFSHPDLWRLPITVGFGIAPNQPTWKVGSWTLPPVRIFTSPRNSDYIIIRHFIFVNYFVISFIYRLKKVTPFLSCAIGILSFVEWVVSISDASTVNGAKRYKLSVISS